MSGRSGTGASSGGGGTRKCAHACSHFDLSFVLNFYLTFNAGIAGIFCHLRFAFASANLLRSTWNREGKGKG